VGTNRFWYVFATTAATATASTATAVDATAVAVVCCDLLIPDRKLDKQMSRLTVVQLHVS
jgi:hypothetical protein